MSENAAASEHRGRVWSTSTNVSLIAVGGIGPAPTDSLVQCVSDDWLQISTGANGDVVGLSIALVDGLQDTTTLDSYEEREQISVRFTSAPFLFVDHQIGWGIDPELHELGIPAGYFDVHVAANNIRQPANDSALYPSIGAAPPVDELPKQINLVLVPRKD